MFEGVMTLIEQVFHTMYLLLIEDLETFSPQAYSYMQVLSGVLQGLGVSVSLIAWAVGMFNSTVSILDTKNPVPVFKNLMRLVIVNVFVIESVNRLLLPLFGIVRAEIGLLFNSVGLGDDFGILSALQSYFDPEGRNPFEYIISLPDLFITPFDFTIIWEILFSVAAIISALVLEMTVLGRILKIYVYIAVAPLPMGLFAGGNATAGFGRNYIKNVLGVMLEGVTMALAIALFRAIVSDTHVLNMIWEQFSVFSNVAKSAMVVLFLGGLSAMIKGADTLTHKLMGFM